MLAELAAFNAGFSVVRQVIANGRDLVDAYSSIEKMVGAKEALRARQKKKEKNVFSVLNSKKANDSAVLAKEIKGLTGWSRVDHDEDPGQGATSPTAHRRRTRGVRGRDPR